MKKGWEIRKAGDLFEMTDFVSNGSFASLRENVEYLDHPDYAVLIRLADYSNGFDRSKFVYVSKQSYEYLAKSKLFGGEIIMSNVGSVGKSFLCPNLSSPMTLGPNAILIRSKNNTFFHYYFQTYEFQRKLLSISSKATLLKFNKTNFKTLDIPVPSLPEQQRIVGILDADFKKIDELKANAEKNLQNAKNLFQAALKKELEPKDGWTTYTLQDICTDFGKYGMSLPSTSFNGIRYLRITDITEWGDLNSDIVSANIDSIEEKYILQDGDLLFARTGATVGKSLLYKDEFGPCSYAGYLIRYRPNRKKVLPKLLFYFTHSPEYYQWVLSTQRASTLPNISAKLYNSLSISLPSVDAQHQIITTLDVLHNKCKELQDNYTKTIALCDDLKQALLRKAFNGEL